MTCHTASEDHSWSSESVNTCGLLLAKLNQIEIGLLKKCDRDSWQAPEFNVSFTYDF